uniref:Amine oxidase domain-containing protein n=1 Tax=Biomphalaria glabrata TaxID=6526 RepID=A0A2C9KYQ8_BIOGL
MFGEEKVLTGGKIVKFQRSKWVSDEFSKGASTYPKVGSDPALWDTFAQPLCPYIYFAGEHTLFDGHGSLHGAYNSGIRAGDQIMTGLCEKQRKERLKVEEKKKKEANETDSAEEEDTDEEDEEISDKKRSKKDEGDKKRSKKDKSKDEGDKKKVQKDKNKIKKDKKKDEL